MPLDLLDRMLIITTKPYEKRDIEHIIDIRCEEEDVEMTEEAKELLTTIGIYFYNFYNKLINII